VPIAGIAADIVLLIHFIFIAFVTTGGLLVLYWPRLAWLHLPCLFWGVGIELSGGICPLTPLEVRLRMIAGKTGYSGDFIDRYLAPIIYPSGLTRELQISLGIVLLLLNTVIYIFLWHRHNHPPDASTMGR